MIVSPIKAQVRGLIACILLNFSTREFHVTWLIKNIWLGTLQGDPQASGFAICERVQIEGQAS